MRFVYTILFVLLSIGLHAQEKWAKLLDYAEVTPNEIQQHCPNFPSESDTFEEDAERWMQQHPNEVQAFFGIPNIEKLNLVPQQFGIELKKPDSPVYDHPYLQWIEAAGLTVAEIQSIAPHFPAPDVREGSMKDYERFEAALYDWMAIFPTEVEDVLNYPELVKLNPYYTQYITLTDVSEELNYHNVSVTEIKPEPSDFDSGNETLDAARYETYVKAWYYIYDTENFYAIYHPEKLEEYKNMLKASEENSH